MPEHIDRSFVTETNSLRELDLSEVDVLYITRVQRERFASDEEFKQCGESYHINAETLRSLPTTSAVLHPLPRVNELSTDVDSLPQAKYFWQMRCGLVLRMALLISMFGREDRSEGFE